MCWHSNGLFCYNIFAPSNLRLTKFGTEWAKIECWNLNTVLQELVCAYILFDYLNHLYVCHKFHASYLVVVWLWRDRRHAHFTTHYIEEWPNVVFICPVFVISIQYLFWCGPRIHLQLYALSISVFVWLPKLMNTTGQIPAFKQERIFWTSWKTFKNLFPLEKKSVLRK